MLKPLSYMPPLLVNSADVVHIRDKQHALDLLREQDRASLTSTSEDQLEQLAQQLADRRIFLIHPVGRTPLDPPKYTPLSPSKHADHDEPIQPAALDDHVGGDPITHQPDAVPQDEFALRIVDEEGVALAFECQLDGAARSSEGAPIELKELDPGTTIEMKFGAVVLWP